MKRWGSFAVYTTDDGWPTVEQLEPFFLAPPGKEWSFEGGSDSWALYGEGMYGTEGLPETERINVSLGMIGHRDHGVYLTYDKWGGRTTSAQSFCGKGDLSRLREYAWSLHGTPLSVGLFIPFAAAWEAVKEFVETDGAMSRKIDWIASKNLPGYAFPDPGKVRRPRS